MSQHRSTFLGLLDWGTHCKEWTRMLVLAHVVCAARCFASEPLSGVNSSLLCLLGLFTTKTGVVVLVLLASWVMLSSVFWEVWGLSTPSVSNWATIHGKQPMKFLHPAWMKMLRLRYPLQQHCWPGTGTDRVNVVSHFVLLAESAGVWREPNFCSQRLSR